ncbi:hypothetical protein DYBT9275_02278 [Dyadobacter sp. CECT 9275]|uniref:Nucleotide-diphospho-sugar transferase n=1 Tax=Dyadobacter helix TaxID=2822344 RepID=A0A916JCA5_9BACT|nr:nucleotide-diphospho-sugar transferase [Dyadobacter sp. CECT 9275]CAG4999680.1 hypothetical protein DYBT9275_02278 [Dyadobacter sp. CECT 9275]
MFATPVLFIIFNRPYIAKRAFDQIKKVKPKYLFIAADGPRPDQQDDFWKCAATREIIKQIDWDCELKTLFREENRGCGYGPAEAITWFFEHVEQGIILEEDCLADESFFYFCEELLQRFRDDPKVSMIAGSNPLINLKWGRESYIFSNMGFSWGWASWRTAWKHFDYTASAWNTKQGQDKVRLHLKRDIYFSHFKREFDHYFGVVRRDVWDFQWLFCRFLQGSYTIIPARNLISNIGFDEDSTHTFDAGINIAQLPLTPISFPLVHPKVRVNKFMEWYLFERFINPGKRSLVKRALLKLIKLVL